ncbi:MAG: Gfo/Idh/MocA family oxidoreductase [Proteobacteria bacterium]|nr:Gfo/Idh/MocA family oxidoreductase [Burkholderiales bacterium]
MNRPVGIGIVGAGRIGTLRARLASRHAGVRFIAIADSDPAQARKAADLCGAAFHGTENATVIAHPEVDAVIVATSEGEHVAPLLQAIAARKPVLVEKPLALTLADADRVIDAAEAAAVDVRVGYSRRYKDRYLIAKEQVAKGRIGRVLGASARVYNSRAQALAMLGRNAHATPVVDALTYYVDLLAWFIDGEALSEVYARGQKGVLAAAGHAADDVDYALLTYADGTVVNLSVSYALPSQYPALGHAARVELIGDQGVMILDDDHTDQLMYSETGVPHVYLPDHQVNMVFLQSGTPGDWALGEFWGPIANETRAWLDHLVLGSPCVLPDLRTARATLEATLAIEASLALGAAVRLPLPA